MAIAASEPVDSSDTRPVVRYRAYDMVFESPIPLFGFPSAPDAPVDVRIQLGATPRRLSKPEVTTPFWHATSSEVLMSVPFVGDYHVSADSTITVDPHTDFDLVSTYLYGVPIGSAMMFRGRTVLHGAAASFDGGAVVIVGENGSGKSTTVSALCQSGAEPLTDNLAVVDFAGDQTSLSPGPGSVRLWQEMADELDVDVSGATEVEPGMGKYLLARPHHQHEPVPLRALVKIEAHPIEKPSLDRLNSVEAAAVVMDNTFRPEVATTIKPDALGDAVRVAESVPVFTLDRPESGFGPRELASFLRTTLP